MKLSYTQLKDVVATYVAKNKIANPTFSATFDNMVGLLDKIGKIVTLDTQYGDKLPQFGGEFLPLGKTIEEWSEDLILPENYDETGANNMAPHKSTYRPVSYSYTFGRKTIPTTIYNNDIERAVNNVAEFDQVVSMKYKRLSDSESSFLYNCKREMIAKLIAYVNDVKTTATTFSNTTAYSVGALVKSGTTYGEIVKPYTSGDATNWADAIAKGYIIVMDLDQVIAPPTDTETGEKFIEQVKKDVEIASDESEGHSLNANSLGATEGLLLIIKQGILPVVDVQVESGCFQLDKLRIPAETIVVKDFGSDNSNAYAVLMDSRGIRLHQSYRAIRKDENGKGDFMTLWLHLELTGFISRNTYVKVYKSA